MAFRAIAYFRFGIQSRVLFLFGVQSNIFVWRSEPLLTFESVFRATTYRSFRRSEPSLFSIGVQSHPHHIFSFGIQSHYRHVSRFRRSEPSSHLCSAFRAIVITSQYRCSEPSSSHFWFQRSEPSLSLLDFDVQSHYHSSVWRSESYPQFLRSESSLLPSLTFGVAFSVLAFRAIVSFSFDVQSHYFPFT